MYVNISISFRMMIAVVTRVAYVLDSSPDSSSNSEFDFSGLVGGTRWGTAKKVNLLSVKVLNGQE